MRILISNDDGFEAKGILAVAQSLSTIAEVVVVAPNRQRSAAGHGITLHKPLFVDVTEIGNGITAYGVNGTPADCVKFGIHEMMKDAPPDLVVSGINAGSNLGTDVIYSGTVSAAIEGAVQGIPSIAVSLCGYDNFDFSGPAAFMVKLVQQVLQHGLLPDTILNVNYPVVDSPQDVRGVKITTLGTRRYENRYDKRTDPRGRDYFWLAGGLKDMQNPPDSDINVVKDKFISVTPVHFDLTERRMLDTLKTWTLD
ncbi:MAG: 5'/3'-nucleotidase SurE [Tumebacillaceae bacterium]